MNDLEKMGIEGIDRHQRNFRLFMAFLKLRKIYFFKKLFFTNRNLTPFDFFKILNKEGPHSYDHFLKNSQQFVNIIDRKWAIIFIFLPYIGSYWDCAFFKERLISIYDMKKISNDWEKFLFEHILE
jgi:hypothetical protein